MAEFINKDLAMSAECATWATGKYAKENANEHFIRGLETYKEWLKNLPIADVAEVKHGRWVVRHRHEHYPSCKPYDENVCPFCRRADHNGDGMYCGYCGAKMDGKECV